jgi:hypothetical protein
MRPILVSIRTEKANVPEHVENNRKNLRPPLLLLMITPVKTATIDRRHQWPFLSHRVNMAYYAVAYAHPFTLLQVQFSLQFCEQILLNSLDLAAEMSGIVLLLLK